MVELLSQTLPRAVGSDAAVSLAAPGGCDAGRGFTAALLPVLVRVTHVVTPSGEGEASGSCPAQRGEGCAPGPVWAP